MMKHFEDQANLLLDQIKRMEDSAAHKDKEIFDVTKRLNEAKNQAAGFKADKLKLEAELQAEKGIVAQQKTKIEEV